jgi:flagellin
VQVVVTGSAQHGTLFVSFGVATLSTAATSGTFTFELTGAKGGREFSFANRTSLAAVASSVNAFKSVTGVSAAAAGTAITLKSDEFGGDQFVGLKLDNDAGQTGNIYYASAPDENAADAATVKTFAAIENSNEERDAGQDIGATINGVTATGTGKTARINTDFLDLSLTLSDTGAQTLATINALRITGGGAKFNLGPNVDITNQVSVGIKDVAARKLGSVDVGYLSDLAKGKDANVVTGSLEDAQEIINEAIDQVSALRGRLGAFQKNVVGATIRSLGVALENTSAAESAIRDTDFAAETAELTRSQILVNAATNVLAIANSQPQSVLKLLG